MGQKKKVNFSRKPMNQIKNKKTPIPLQNYCTVPTEMALRNQGEKQ